MKSRMKKFIDAHEQWFDEKTINYMEEYIGKENTVNWDDCEV